MVAMSEIVANVARIAKEVNHRLSRAAENNSKGWPKFDGKILSYPTWKRVWKKHHENVYPELTVETLKKVLVEQCLPEEVKDRITYKQTMEEVWKFLDITYVRPNQYFADLMKPIVNAKELSERDYKGLERNLELLLHTFERAREDGMLDRVLHVNTLRQMYEKWPHDERVKWWRITVEVPLSEQPQRFWEFAQRQYLQVAMVAYQDAVSGSSDEGQESGEGGQYPKKKRKQPKVMVNAAQAAALAAPTQPQRQQ